MKLLSPVNSIESARKQIEAGANEIYLGLDAKVFKSYSFSGRGQASKNVKKIEINQDNLYQIVKMAHNNDVKVSLAANTPMFSEYAVENMEDKYIQMIESGIETGIDNIIIGDIGLLYSISKRGLPVNIHASTYFDTMSMAQIEFLKSLGANRVVLTYQSHIKEIEKIVKSHLVEIEVFGFLGCSFFNGACNFVHEMGEEDDGNKSIVGVHCKSKFEVTENGNFLGNMPFLDSSLACGLCSIKRLSEIGVDVIKIGGRDQNSEFIKQITRLFRMAIDYADKNNDKKYQEYIKNIKYSWWENFYCKKGFCKYMDNKIADSFIGIL